MLGNLDAFRPLPVLPRSAYESTSSELEEVFRTLREEILYTYPAFNAPADPALVEKEPAAEREPSVTESESEPESEPEAEPEGDGVLSAPIESGPVPQEPLLGLATAQKARRRLPRAARALWMPRPRSRPSTCSDPKRRAANTKRHRLGLGVIVALVALILGAGGGGAYAYFSSAAPGSGSAATARNPVTMTVTAASGTADLVPGGTGSVTFTFKGADPLHATFNDVTGASVVASSNASGCPIANLTFAQTIPYAFSPAISATPSVAGAPHSIAGLARLCPRRQTCARGSPSR